MPIVGSDIQFRLSGGAGNTDPNASLGGALSSTAAPAGIFDAVSSGEAASGDAEYRCVYARNNHATLTLLNARIFIQANTPSSATDVAIALAGEGKNGTAETVADENTAPSGETFSQPANYAAGLALGDLAPGESFPVWVRRSVTAGATVAADGFTLRVQGDTNP